MLRFDLVLALSLCAALAVPMAARGDDLPPAKAPAFSGVYKMTSRSREKAQDEWTFTNDDTVTIAVSATKVSRWDYKSDGRSLIVDQVSQATTTFGGKNPPNVAYRSVAGYVAIGWEFGYEIVTKVNDNKPQVLGKTTIAGTECTQVRLSSEQYGEPEYCVSKTGIVLRFANKSSTAETEYVAQSIDPTAPDDKRFSVPVGTKVEERGAMPRKPKIF